MQDLVYNKRDKLLIFIILILFRLTLDFMYLYIIQEEYINITILALGFERGAFSFHYDAFRILFSFFVSFILLFFLVKQVIRFDSPHELINTGLFGISFLPNMVMFAYSDIEWRFGLLQTLFWSWFLIIGMYLTKKQSVSTDGGEARVGLTKIFSKRAAVFLFWAVALFFVFGSVVLTYNYHGGFHINLSFQGSDVYDSRFAARGAFNPILNYFRNNAMYVVVPLLANYFLIKRRFPLFFVSCIVLLLLFSVDSQKAVIMLAIVSFISAHVIRDKISKSITKGLLFVNLIVIVLYLCTDNLLFVDYLVKRIYFLPAIIGSCYYDFVTTNGNMVLFSSLLQDMGVISDYAYADISLPFLIGRYFFGSVSISANTGAFGGAYAYGLISLFITPMAYGFLFSLLNKVTCNIESKYYMPFIVVTVFVIEGTTIPSVLLVYGYIVGLLLLYIMNNADVFKPAGNIRFKFRFGRQK